MEDIAATAEEIGRLKQRIQNAADAKERRRLTRKKRELQYLQLWRIDLLERSAGDES